MREEFPEDVEPVFLELLMTKRFLGALARLVTPEQSVPE